MLFNSKFPVQNQCLSLFYMISLAYKTSYCLSSTHNPELRCAICTGVTLGLGLELHWNYTALIYSESSNFFMSIISNPIHGKF